MAGRMFRTAAGRWWAVLLVVLQAVLLAALVLTACTPVGEEENAPVDGAGALPEGGGQGEVGDASEGEDENEGENEGESESAPVLFEPRVELAPVAEGFAAPVALVEAPDGSARLFVVDQVGLVYVLDADGQRLETPFLDLRERIVDLNPGYDERGLLGLAFHPDYADNGRFFVHYSAPLREGAPQGWDNTAYISEFRVAQGDADRADPGSERVLLQVDQPQANHAGGQIVFGPDGYLYVPLGDGGGANDVGSGHVEDWYEANAGGNGQDATQNLLGSILRIDVDGGDPYGIPPDNPFAAEGDERLDEIYAYGFRNPFHIAFDPGGERELFAGDAGQALWEEVDIVRPGGNYGWNVREGAHCFDTSQPGQPLDACPQSGPDGEPLIDPILEFANAQQPDGLGTVVVGGAVYRGSALPAFDGRYIFGTWSRGGGQGEGLLFVATRPEAEAELWPFETLAVEGSPGGGLGAYLLSFGQDSTGEIYVLTSQQAGPSGDTGRVWRIVPPS